MWSLFRRLAEFFYAKASRLWQRLGLGPKPYSTHMQNMIEYANKFHAKFPSLPDRFPPYIPPADGPVVASFHARWIAYYYTEKVFIKRQPHPDELGNNIYGDPAISPYMAERLRNEAAALQFVAANTTIPVPQLLGIWEENGLVHLKTAMEHRGVDMRDLDPSVMQRAVGVVTAQLEEEILPQLHRLRRNFMGSADPRLAVLPPRRHWDRKGSITFPSLPRASDDYVFIHSDLDRQNFLVDPETFRIVSLIDWETAGFFPAEWELPFWKMDSHEEKYKIFMEAKEREKGIFEVTETARDVS